MIRISQRFIKNRYYVGVGAAERGWQGLAIVSMRHRRDMHFQIDCILGMLLIELHASGYGIVHVPTGHHVYGMVPAQNY